MGKEETKLLLFTYDIISTEKAAKTSESNKMHDTRPMYKKLVLSLHISNKKEKLK
jgi:hypothetical protein